jgi:heme A synthase
MYSTLLALHIAGAFATFAAVVSAGAAINKNAAHSNLNTHAKLIGGMSVVQLATGAMLMVNSSGSIAKGCVSLGVYAAVVIAAEAMLISKMRKVTKKMTA